MAGDAGTNVALQTVSHVDLSRYIGRWYEIAKYPNRFERKCDRNVTASYAIRPDGKISVVNACTTREGKPTVSTGWAKVVDQKTGAKLKVTFFWPFFGDYWWANQAGNTYGSSAVRRRWTTVSMLKS